MKIHHDLDHIERLPFAVVTSGTFDGVHKGHQQILRRLKSVAKASNGQTVLITFWPHPRLVVDPEYNLKLLTVFEEKAPLLAAYGIDHLIRIPFTKKFSQLSSEDFIQQILVDKIGTKKLVIGYDHRFGRNREGSFDYLKANATNYGFEVEEIPRHEIDHTVISSTRIRKALADGDIHIGNEYLGRKYSLEGRVVEGLKLGRKLGFPTANLKIEAEHKLIPCDGIYAVEVGFENKTWKGMLNIGFRPTIEGAGRSIEVNIFDFDQDIYGEILEINFAQLIRREEKFENLEGLKSQLLKDRTSALQILK